MKRVQLSACLLALALAAVPASGQGVYVMVGPSFPIGDFGDYANTGIHAAGGLTFELAERLDLYGEGFWGQNGHDEDGAKTNPYGGIAGVLVDLADGSVEPYAFGGAGIMVHRYSFDSDGFSGDDSESAFAFQLGAGIEFELGGLDAFTEARFLSASFEAESPGLDDESTSFLAVAIGLVFGLGGGEGN